MTDTSPVYRRAGEGAARNVLGSTHLNVITPADNGGAFLMIESTIPPGCGAPLHRHAVDTECFRILEGELTFRTPEGSFVGRAGDTCLLPAGGTHGFVNESGADVRVLIVTTPGRDAEAFFDEVDRQSQAGAPNLDAVVAAAGRHRLHILPPA